MTVRNGLRPCLYKEILSKYPSFPRAHHPIIRDLTSIWLFAGLDLVQLGNRSFRDFSCQVCKSRLLEVPSFRSRSFFAEVCNLCTMFPDVGTTNRYSWNWIRSLGSLRKILNFLVFEFTTQHVAKFWSIILLSTALSSFPFLLFPFLSCASEVRCCIVDNTIERLWQVKGDARDYVSIHMLVLKTTT